MVPFRGARSSPECRLRGRCCALPLEKVPFGMVCARRCGGNAILASFGAADRARRVTAACIAAEPPGWARHRLDMAGRLTRTVGRYRRTLIRRGRIAARLTAYRALRWGQSGWGSSCSRIVRLGSGLPPTVRAYKRSLCCRTNASGMPQPCAGSLSGSVSE